MKTIVVFLASFFFVSLTMSPYANSSEVVTLSMIAVLVIIVQCMCIVISNKIRVAIVNAERAPLDTELGHVPESTAQQSQQSSPQPPRSDIPFPYPPQYTPYMYSPNAQGYPVPVMPYGFVPYGPQGAVYPAPTDANGQPQMPAVYPYMYSPSQPETHEQQQKQEQQPTYTFINPPQVPGEPSENDKAALLQKNGEN